MRHDARWFDAEVIATRDVTVYLREIARHGGVPIFSVGGNIDVRVPIDIAGVTKPIPGRATP